MDLGMNIEYYGECLVETMPQYSQFQFTLFFGNNWKKDENNLEQLLESIPEMDSSLLDNVKVIKKLWKEQKVSHPYKLIYLINIELPHYLHHQGKGKAVLQQVLNKSKKEGFEYLLCNAVTSSGNKFVKNNGFENIQNNYWGISLK